MDLEKKLLQKLNSGFFDGLVGNSTSTPGGSTVWTEIKNGVPATYKQGPDRKFFNGKENETLHGKLTKKNEWTYDEDKIFFLQKFGWLLPDEEAKEYSKAYKNKI